MNMTGLLLNIAIAKSAGLGLTGTIETLKILLSQAWKKQTRSLINNLVNEAEVLGSIGNISEDDVERINEKAKMMLGVDLKDSVRSGVLTLTERAFNIGSKASAGISLAQKNFGALRVLQDDFLFWIENEYDRHFSDDMNALMRNYFEAGMTRAQIVQGMQERLSSKQKYAEDRWGLIADTNASRIAEVGHVAGYEEAGVEYVQIVAVLDDKTSEICRHLHGRKIPVSAMALQRDGIIAAAKRHDIEATKKIHPMLLQQSPVLSMTKTSDIVDENVGLPPYHFRCRTTTVAYFEPATYHEKAAQMAVDGEVSTKDAVRLIDYARNARWGTHKAVWRKNIGGDGKKHLTSFTHYKKHGEREMGISSMAAYNAAAINLVRRADRDVSLAILNKEHPYPVLLFHNPKTKEYAVVNIKGQNIASYFELNNKRWNAMLEEHNVVVQLKGGIVKWIRRIFI